MPKKRSALTNFMKEQSLARAHYAAKTLFPTPLFPLIKNVCFPLYTLLIAEAKFSSIL